MEFLDKLSVQLAVALLIAMPSLVWMGGLLRWRRKSRSIRLPDLEPGATFGVAVVGRNEAERVGTCLKSILETSPPVDQVLFVDDCSEDQTLYIAKAIAATDSRLTVQSSSARQKCASPKKEALADAFHGMKTTWIAVTDADCEVPRGWLAALRNSASDQTGAVIGASWPHCESGFAHRAYRWERLIANSSMASACGWGLPASACGHSILYSRKALHDTDAPVRRDLRSGDDDLTVQAIAKAGYDVQFCADPLSLVREAGARGSRTDQVSRHQSVVRYYPRRWRALYVFTAAASIAAPVVIAMSFGGMIPTLIGVSGGAKIAVDWLSGLVFARQLGIDISAGDVLCGALILPFWMLWRILAFLLPKGHSWRGRDFRGAHLTMSAPKQ